MSKISQSNEDLKQHLWEQVAFLRASCDAFDSGHLHEAKRLSLSIRVLVHDAGGPSGLSRSLLTQLGLKHAMRFVSSHTYDIEENLLPYHGLVGVQITMGGDNPGVRYYAHCRSPLEPRFRLGTFEKWWEHQILNDRQGSTFTRRSLVSTMANQDGGAHIDPKVSEAYARLTRSQGIGIRLHDHDLNDVGPLMQVELHSVRQIAWELLMSLDHHFCDERGLASE